MAACGGQKKVQTREGQKYSGRRQESLLAQQGDTTQSFPAFLHNTLATLPPAEGSLEMLGKVLFVVFLGVLIAMDPDGCLETVGHIGGALGHLCGAVSSIGKAIIAFLSISINVPLELASRAAVSLEVIPPPPGRYVGQVIVVTGASSGIGEAVAYEAAAQGASLVLAARRVDRLKGVAARCIELGAKDVLIQEYNAQSTSAGPELIDASIKRFNR